MDVARLVRTSSLRAGYRLRRGQWGFVATVAIVIRVVVFGIIELKSQTVSSSTPSFDAEFYLKRGEDLSGLRQYSRAIDDYTTAIKLKPDYAEAYNDRAFAYYLNREFERAIADYTRAIELRPNYPKAYNSRGVVYMAGGYGAAKSVPDFDRAIELKPDFRYAYINRANARLFSHPLLALQDFHRAGMHPERTVALVACLLTVVVAFAFLLLRRRRLR
jgi:tetratricopeptide (TPR) repeat protein